MRKKSKPLRLECRISPHVKAVIEKAAYLSGVSLTDFVIEAALIKAFERIQQYNEMKMYEMKDMK